jgi:hypothetical protein
LITKEERVVMKIRMSFFLLTFLCSADFAAAETVVDDSRYCAFAGSSFGLYKKMDAYVLEQCEDGMLMVMGFANADTIATHCKRGTVEAYGLSNDNGEISVVCEYRKEPRKKIGMTLREWKKRKKVLP